MTDVLHLVIRISSCYLEHLLPLTGKHQDVRVSINVMQWYLYLKCYSLTDLIYGVLSSPIIPLRAKRVGEIIEIRHKKNLVCIDGLIAN